MKATDLKLGQRVRFLAELVRTTEPEEGDRRWRMRRRWLPVLPLHPVTREGIVAGIRWLPSGVLHLASRNSFFSDDSDETYLEVQSTTPAALIAYDVRRKPIFVAVEDLEVIE